MGWSRLRLWPFRFIPHRCTPFSQETLVWATLTCTGSLLTSAGRFHSRICTTICPLDALFPCKKCNKSLLKSCLGMRRLKLGTVLVPFICTWRMHLGNMKVMTVVCLPRGIREHGSEDTAVSWCVTLSIHQHKISTFILNIPCWACLQQTEHFQQNIEISFNTKWGANRWG